MAALVMVKLGGSEYPMKPSFQSYSDIEDRTGMTVQELLECALHLRLRMSEAVAIVWCGCGAAGEKFDALDAVGMRLFEQRLTDQALRGSLCKFLLALLHTPEEATKKWQAEVEPILKDQAAIT